MKDCFSGIEKDLKKIKNKHFMKFVTKESEAWELDKDSLDDVFYSERRKVLDLSNKFKKGALKACSLEDLNDELIDLFEGKEYFDVQGKFYEDLTGKPSALYMQYKKLFRDFCEDLVFEVVDRVMNGDYR